MNITQSVRDFLKHFRATPEPIDYCVPWEDPVPSGWQQREGFRLIHVAFVPGRNINYAICVKNEGGEGRRWIVIDLEVSGESFRGVLIDPDVLDQVIEGLVFASHAIGRPYTDLPF